MRLLLPCNKFSEIKSVEECLYYDYGLGSTQWVLQSPGPFWKLFFVSYLKRLKNPPACHPEGGGLGVGELGVK